MILKEQDDRWRDVELLQRALRQPNCDPRLKGRIEDEIRKIKAGDRGERMAAHVLDTHYGKSENWVLLHDLRVEHDGEVAQIDHLLISRCLDFWLLESKNFANGVKINQHGEFLTFFEGRPRGVDSPIEQGRRHMRIMQRLLDAGALPLPTRLGITLKPKLRTLVLISGGSIGRPKLPIPGIETVVRSDQAATLIQQMDAKGNPLDLARLVGTKRLHELGQSLAALHRPIQFDWNRRLGLSPQPKPAERKAILVATCDNCGVDISVGVVRFCRKNADALDGQALCVMCQRGRQTTAA